MEIARKVNFEEIKHTEKHNEKLERLSLRRKAELKLGSTWRSNLINLTTGSIPTEFKYDNFLSFPEFHWSQKEIDSFRIYFRKKLKFIWP